LVYPTKYRKKVIDKEVETLITEACKQIAERYEIHFVEIGTDKDHIHLLIQTVPTYSVTKLVTMTKSLIAKYVFNNMPELKKAMWGANLWTSGYYASTVGKHGNENSVSNYVKKQGLDNYVQLHKDQLQLL
jgi:putative transposase